MRLWRRLTINRSDGRTYLNRWGVRVRWFSVYLHRMDAPDPGNDLHDHPWTMLAVPLWGGYFEWRENVRDAVESVRTGGFKVLEERRPFRPRLTQPGEAHRIVELRRKTSWSLVVTGPRRRDWGFYTPDGYIDADEYDATRRHLRDVSA